MLTAVLLCAPYLEQWVPDVIKSGTLNDCRSIDLKDSTEQH